VPFFAALAAFFGRLLMSLPTFFQHLLMVSPAFFELLLMVTAAFFHFLLVVSPAFFEHLLMVPASFFHHLAAVTAAFFHFLLVVSPAFFEHLLMVPASFFASAVGMVPVMSCAALDEQLEWCGNRPERECVSRHKNPQCRRHTTTRHNEGVRNRVRARGARLISDCDAQPAPIWPQALENHMLADPGGRDATGKRHR
jgi:hypothetical protein